MSWRRKGLRFEDRARSYLERRGLSLLSQNFHGRRGEIDLIMRDGDRICFIEVKYRKSRAYGGAANAIPAAKRRRIVDTALYYLSTRAAAARLAPRFDAVLIQQQPDGGEAIEWIRNAFYAE
jgi:putative endonuclease